MKYRWTVWELVEGRYYKQAEGEHEDFWRAQNEMIAAHEKLTWNNPSRHYQSSTKCIEEEGDVE